MCAEHSFTCGWCQNIIHIYHLMLYETGGQIGLGEVSTVVDLCVKVPRYSLICSDPLKKADHSTNLHKTYIAVVSNEIAVWTVCNRIGV